MANKNFDHVSHIKSRLPREIEEGEFYGLTPTTDNSEAEGSSPIKLNLAKRPTAENLIEGEIAVNYLKGHETLTIKNTEDEIVAFVNENDFNEAQEIVALGLAQEKNERVSDIARLESKISDEIGDKLDELEDEVDERFADLDENIERLELGISSSLNDLNSRVNAMGDISGDMIDELESKFNTDIENINETITDMELVISASLNDLNSRIIETDGKFAEIENTFNEFDEGIERIEHTISASLNDLNSRIIDNEDTIQELGEDMGELSDQVELNKTNLNNLSTEVSTLSNDVDSLENDVTVIKNYSYFDEQLGIPVWWNGSKYVDNNGFTAALKKGPSSSRPTLTSDDDGYVYYDTDMNVNIIWDGEKWTQGGIPKKLSDIGSLTTLGTLPNVEFKPYMSSESGGPGVLFCNLRSTQVPFEIGYCYTNDALNPPSLYDNKTNFGQPYASLYDEGYVVYRGSSTLEASATNPIFIRCYFHYTAPVNATYTLFSDVYKYDGTTFEKYTQP